MRPVRLIAAAAAAALALSGCGEMKEGDVIGKKYEPAATYTIMLPIQTSQICYSSGTTRFCNPIYTYFPYIVHDGEDFILRLRNGDDEGIMYVDRPTWERAQNGDHITKDDGGVFGDDDTTLTQRRK